MDVSLTILGVDGESLPSVMIESQHTKYIFNIGEGLMRSSLEHKVKSRYAEKVFFTELNSNTISDFPSFLLRVHNMGKHESRYFGPQNLANFILSTRYYISKRHTMYVTELDGNNDESVTDENLTVHPVVIYPDIPSEVSSEAVHSHSIFPILPSTHANITLEEIQRVQNILSLKKEMVILQCPIRQVENNRGKRGETFSADEYIEWVRFRAGVVDGFEVLDDFLLAQFIQKFPSGYDYSNRSFSSKIDFKTDQTPNEKDPNTEILEIADSRVLKLKCRHHTMVLSSPRVSSLRANPLVSSYFAALRANTFLQESVFGPIDSLRYILPPANTVHTKKHHLEFLPKEEGGSVVQTHSVEKQQQQGLPMAISYICHTPQTPGKFDAKKAALLGVPKGPLCGKLTKGETIILPNGATVKPSDVISPSSLGPVIFVIACPDLIYLNNLVNNPKWNTYYFPHSQFKVSCIVHITPHHIISTPIYKQFMNSFGESVQHVVINKESCRKHPIYRSSSELLAKINSVNTQIFPLPPTFQDNPPNIFYEKQIGENLPSKIIGADLYMKFIVCPVDKSRIDTTACLPIFDPLSIQKDFSTTSKKTNESTPTQNPPSNDHPLQPLHPLIPLNLPHLLDNHTNNNNDNSKNNNNNDNKENSLNVPVLKKHFMSSSRGQGVEELLHKLPDNHLRIIFLGTGCSSASPYRNETSILLDFFERGMMLLDCGNGTTVQLYRKFGDEVENTLRSIKCVWISHSHSDHHSGLIRFLHKRHLAVKKYESSHPQKIDPVVVIGPRSFANYLADYNECCSCLCNGSPHPEIEYVFIDSESLVISNSQQATSTPYSLETIQRFFSTQFGLCNVFNVTVNHCFLSYALVMQHSLGWSLVFSGDTSFCPNLISSHPHPTILIHEATFEDSLQEMALSKAHCTVQDALNTGRQMQAYRVILTHFSQRYPQAMSNTEEQDRVHTCSAFDLFEFNIKDTPLLPDWLYFVENAIGNEGENERVEIE